MVDSIELKLVITGSIKMNKSRTPSEAFCDVDLNSEDCKNKNITFSVSEPIWLTTRYFSGLSDALFNQRRG